MYVKLRAKRNAADTLAENNERPQRAVANRGVETDFVR